MKYPAAALLLVLALGACREYNYLDHIDDQSGTLPADQFAGYGRRQAIMVAVGREFGRPYNSGKGAQARIAMTYARQFPEVVNVTADTLGHRLTLTFDNGWMVAVVPIDDGKRGTDTRIPD